MQPPVPSDQRHHHCVELVALAFVHRDGVGEIKLMNLIEGVDGPPVVKADHNRAGGAVDHFNETDVAVEDSQTFLAVVPLPFEIVVVAGLHHLVPLTQQKLPEAVLAAAGLRGVDAS